MQLNFLEIFQRLLLKHEWATLILYRFNKLIKCSFLPVKKNPGYIVTVLPPLQEGACSVRWFLSKVMMSEPSPLSSHELWRCWTLHLWACVPCLAELASLLIWHWIQSTRGSCSKVRALHKSPLILANSNFDRDTASSKFLPENDFVLLSCTSL